VCVCVCAEGIGGAQREGGTLSATELIIISSRTECKPLTHRRPPHATKRTHPLRYQHLGSMMSLGAANAAVALPLELPAALASSIKGTPLDSLLAIVGVDATAQGGVTLEGPLAQLLRRAAYLYRQPTGEQRLSVAASWVQQAAEVAARAAQELSERVQQQPTGVGGDDRRS